MTTPLTDTSTVELHPLHIGPPEDGVHEVGRPDTGTFIGLPGEGVAVIEWLSSGLTLAEAGERFTQRYGSAPELADFLAALEECGFVRAIDGRAVQAEDTTAEATRPRGWRLLSGLPQSAVGWLLAPPLRVLYALVWLAVPALLLARPELLPRSGDALVHPRPMTSMIVLTLIGWALIFLHELAHLLTARARGCVGSLSVGRRMYFLVAQTDMTGVRALPRKERYAPYLAGITFDLSVLLVCWTLRLSGLDSGYARAVAYLCAVQFVFQCAVFLRTDLYYVLTNWLRLGNLNADARLMLHNLTNRLRGRPPTPLTGIPEREQRIIRRYLPLHVLGILIALANLCWLVVPATVSLVRRSVEALTSGDLLTRLDGLGFLLILTLNLGTLLTVTVRERRTAAHGQGPPAS
ncbi:hypothetical protein GCM10020229_16770 [Kitasatospora albolonga]|uniref:hypothetical protein n=1 Tax=Kitasatospora albolonga TaxID=68173 RepID=UPI0031ECA22C